MTLHTQCWLFLDFSKPLSRQKQEMRDGKVTTSEEVAFSLETSVSSEAAVVGPTGKRLSKVDQVVKAPKSFNGSSALVVIRSFCRFAPLESDAPHCRKPEPLYFYNVTSAACEPFYGGHCQRSRNRFKNIADCLKVVIDITVKYMWLQKREEIMLRF